MSDEKKPSKGLRIELNPRVVVLTSQGEIFVFEPNRKAVEAYSKMATADVSEKVRLLLAGCSSLTDRGADSTRPPPLTEEQTRTLTIDDVELMASAYLKMQNSLYYIEKAKADKPPVLRQEGESSVAFLDRLLRWHPEHDRRELKALRDSMAGGSAVMRAMEQFRGIDEIARKYREDPVFKAAESTKKMIDSVLGREGIDAISKLQNDASGLSKLIEETRQQKNTLDALRQSGLLKEVSSAAAARDLIENYQPIPSVRMPTMRDTLREHAAELNQAADNREQKRLAERDEEIQINRSIQDLTMRSSDLLAQLTQASTTIVERFGIFLSEFKDSARRSMRWAVGSLVVTAALTVIGGWFAGKSFYQDKESNRGNDKWQAEVSELLKAQGVASEKARQELAIENGQLRQRIDVLEKSLKELAKPPARQAAPRTK